MSSREVKSSVVTIRLTPAQKDLLESGAMASGLSTSSFLLWFGLEGARNVVHRAKTTPMTRAKNKKSNSRQNNESV